MNLRIFFLIFILSLTAFIIVHPFTLVGGDEGRFVQDALRIGRGEVPIADYGTRAPILSWFIYIFAKLFGNSLFVYRLPGIIFSALTAGFIFLLGKELFSKGVGVVAALIFAFVPFTLWNNVVIKTEALTILLVVLAALFLAKGIKNNLSYLFLLSGVFLGIAYIERQSALAFMLTSALVVIWAAVSEKGADLKKMVKQVFSRGLLLGGGVVLGILPVFLFISYYDASRAIQYWFSLYAVEGALSAKRVVYSSWWISVYHFFRNWVLAFVEILAVQAGILFSGFVVFVAVFIYSILHGRDRLKKVVSISVITVMMGALLAHSLRIYFIGTFRPYVFLMSAVFSVLFVSFLWRYAVLKGVLRELLQRYQQSSLFLLFWVIGLLVAYSFFVPGYPREFVPALSLIIAFVLVSVPWRTLGAGVLTVAFILIAGFCGVGIAWFTDPIIGGWWWTQDTINRTAEYLREHTYEGEEIFTANPLPVMLASRRVSGDITSYSIKMAKNADDRVGMFLSPNQLIAMLRDNPPRYAIVDGRMEGHFFRQYRFFEEFVKENYELAVVYGRGERRGETQIWARKD